MIIETSAVNFRQNLGEMLKQVQYRHDSVVINKDGKPVAALVDPNVRAHSPHAGPLRCAMQTHRSGLRRAARSGRVG